MVIAKLLAGLAPLILEVEMWWNKSNTKSVDAPVADKAIKEPSAKKSYTDTVKTLSVHCSGPTCVIMGTDSSGARINHRIECDGSVKVSIGA